MTTTRTDVPRTGGERELLRAYLDFHRETLAGKCAGLGDEELRRAAAPPSSLSLLGLVRHMAEVERSWFRRVVDGQDVPLVWSPGGDFQAAFDVAGASVAEARAAWEAEIGHARRIERAAASLEVTGVDRRSGEEYSLRRVLVHVIQEYARHNGHADLIRERIDGATGV
ncbi:DinB family protein [Blastococcus sp. TF02A-30]|uniref:DinB family protein n=1 Tax=Blastococcus sp. TF02A-30 TaxID=2250580 RepID=UPI000DEBC4AE|nr:DinB family protein [Blastococcus sp. TF02A-30]RBY85798.1 Mini-circle protein [Blastococcus sp. TF02A-30]